MAYIDESYDRGRFVLGVVMVDARAAGEIRTGFDRVVGDAHERFGIPLEAEVHAHDLVQGAGSWAVLAGRTRARVNVLNSAVDVIAGSSAQLFVASVEARATTPPIASASAVSGAYSQAFRDVVMLIDDRCAREGKKFALIADEVVDEDLHRRSLLTTSPSERALFATRRASCLVDTVYFGPSHASRLLQAADVCSYVFRRAMASRGREDLAARTVRAMAYRLHGIVRGECANTR